MFWPGGEQLARHGRGPGLGELPLREMPLLLLPDGTDDLRHWDRSGVLSPGGRGSVPSSTCGTVSGLCRLSKLLKTRGC